MKAESIPKTMKTAHTPTPWINTGTDEIEAMTGKTGKAHILAVIQRNYDEAHNPNEAASVAQANAAFIVKAVNCHEDLVIATETLMQQFKNELIDADYSEMEIENLSFFKHARKALAKATKE